MSVPYTQFPISTREVDLDKFASDVQKASDKATEAEGHASDALVNKNNAETFANNSFSSKESSEVAKTEAETARDQSESFSLVSQSWAEGEAPGGVGTKSAKEWADSIPIIEGPEGPEGPQGPKGDTGDQGPIGEGLEVLGVLNNISELPASNNSIGDAYIVEGNYWVWNGSEWQNAGLLQGVEGPQGPIGETGPQGPKGDTGDQGIQGPEGPAGTTDYNELLNVPSTFTPSAHTHTLADITDSGGAAALNVGITAGTVAAGDHGHSDATTSISGFMSGGDKTKLDGVATGATANQTDAHLLSRTNHTGTQAANTITGLSAVATTGTYNDLLDVPSTFPPSAHNQAISTITGLQDALDGKGTVSSLTAGVGLTGGTITTTGTIDVDIATDSNITAGDANKLISSGQIYSSNAPVVTSGTGSFTLDFNGGRVFQRTLTGNSTMSNPTNQVAGQSGVIYIIQDATGGRTLSLGSDWNPIGGAPTIDTDANKVNVFSYYVRAANNISLSYLGAE